MRLDDHAFMRINSLRIIRDLSCNCSVNLKRSDDMEATTYTRRENARRAGVKAGVPAQRIKITVHKRNGEVRFGWREMPEEAAAGRVQLQATAATTPGASSTEAAPTPPRSDCSTPKRPRAGGKCAAVWDYLDGHPMTTAAELREVATAQGWNVNNATCELYAWRRAKESAAKQS